MWNFHFAFILCGLWKKRIKNKWCWNVPAVGVPLLPVAMTQNMFRNSSAPHVTCPLFVTGKCTCVFLPAVVKRAVLRHHYFCSPICVDDIRYVSFIFMAGKAKWSVATGSLVWVWFLASLLCANRLWDPLSPLSNGQWCLFYRANFQAAYRHERTFEWALMNNLARSSVYGSTNRPHLFHFSWRMTNANRWISAYKC
jgi:hypothetical protein